MLYVLHSTSVLSFYIDVVFTLSIWLKFLEKYMVKLSEANVSGPLPDLNLTLQIILSDWWLIASELTM